MPRHPEGLPTHRWMLANKLRDWLAYLFIFVLICIAIAIASVHAIVQHNCEDWYKRDAQIFSKWIHVEVGSNKEGCPMPYERNG